MSRTANANKNQRNRIEIEKVLCDASIPKSLTEALQSLLAGMDYDDPAIIRSSIETAMKTLADVIGEAIEKRLGWPQVAREHCREIWDCARDNPCENVDEVGSSLQTYFDEMLKVLGDLRDGPVKTLMAKGYEIENAAQLESDFKELEQLKMEVLANWPWSNKDLPPVNVEMMKSSMAALAHGEKGEKIEDLIARLGGNKIR